MERNDDMPLVAIDALRQNMASTATEKDISYNDPFASISTSGNTLINNVATVNRLPTAARGRSTAYCQEAANIVFSGQNRVNTSAGSFNNSQIYEMKTGEPTSNIIANTSRKHHNNIHRGNHSSLSRSSSEPMFTDLLPMMNSHEAVVGDRADAFGSNNSLQNYSAPPTLERRKSEPASSLFEDNYLGQDLNNGAPVNARETFVDGFHTPPPLATPPTDETNPVQGSNWDDFRIPSPTPIEREVKLGVRTNTISMPKLSRHLPNPDVVNFVTKTGEDSDRLGRSRHLLINAPLKRSRSADPLMMQEVTNKNGHQDSELVDIFRLLNPAEQQQLQEMGIHSREIPKRRRSEPFMTDDIFNEYFGGINGGNFKPSRTIETNLSRDSSNMNQTDPGMKRGDSGQLFEVSELMKRFLPVKSSGQYHQHFANKNGNTTMNFKPTPSNSAMHQNFNMLMPLTLPNACPSSIGRSKPITSQQNSSTAMNDEDELSDILKAITETHTNLQLLQTAVAQCQDQRAVESITKAFELTAASSQFVVQMQYHTAYHLLNQTWSHIKIVESRLAALGETAGHLPARFGTNLNGIPLLPAEEPLCLPQKSKKKRKPKKSPKKKVPELHELPPQNKDDPEVIMIRLNALMERTVMSQINLQKYDKQNGLPKSHAQTMIQSSRSRKQLQKDLAVTKPDGTLSGQNEPKQGTNVEKKKIEDTKSLELEQP